MIDEEHRGSVIDVNPRLVEPVSPELSGTDLVGAMLAASLGEHVAAPAEGRSGVRTHMLLMAMLRQGEVRRGRRFVRSELARALARQEPYAHSTEELLPVYDDPGALLPLLGVSVTLLAWPEAWQRFTAGGASSQALTPDSWQSLIAGDL